MTAFNQDQRYALAFIISLAGCSCLFDISQAQTLTAEDRLSVLKFVGAFMNFLDLELENSTTAASATSTTDVTVTTLESTTLTSSGNSTEVTTTEVTTSSSFSSSSSVDPDTSTSTTTTTEAARTTTARRRMCFKRFCYKFGGDKGYIV